MSEQGIDVEVTHHFAQAPERVFTGWSDAELFGKWFAYEWGRECTAEFSPGGRYSISGVMPDGTTFECGGEYTAIESPHRVSHTFEWHGDPEVPNSNIPEEGPRPIDVALAAADDGGTDVTFRHGGTAHEMSAKGHAEAWRACLARLEGLL